MDFDVVDVKDPEAAWGDIRRLFLELDEYHRPLTGRRLRPEWETLLHSHLQEVPDGLVLLARAGGRAIGFTNGSVIRGPLFDETDGYVENMYVEAEWQSKGVGRAMLRRFEEWCRARGAQDIRLSVVAANAGGIAAWTAMGFEPWSHSLRKRIET